MHSNPFLRVVAPSNYETEILSLDQELPSFVLLSSTLTADLLFIRHKHKVIRKSSQRAILPLLRKSAQSPIPALRP